MLLEDKSKQKICNLLKTGRINFEKGWHIVNACHDIPNLTSLKECDTQLTEMEEGYLNANVISQADNVPSPVDPDKLLDIQKKVGLRCPECKEQETTYKLFANRSADDGMTAFCTCRVCSHKWSIKM